METKVWHQSDVTARYSWINSTHSPDHFWEEKCSTLKACKIVLFNSRRLKLWNRVFDKVNFNTKQKQISLHRHFKPLISHTWIKVPLADFLSSVFKTFLRKADKLECSWAVKYFSHSLSDCILSWVYCSRATASGVAHCNRSSCDCL